MFIIRLFLLEYCTLFLKNVNYNLGTVAFGHYGRRVRRYVCIRRTRFSTEPLERPVQTCLVRDIIIVVPQCSGLAFSFHNVWLYFFDCQILITILSGHRTASVTPAIVSQAVQL